MTRLAIHEAKAGLTAAVRSAEGGEPVQLTRHGKPVAVLVSSETWQTLNISPCFSDTLDRFLKDFATARDTGDGQEFERLRSGDTGRDVTL